MENENKCFFSISLENGITLTADDPDSMKNFLYEMHKAFFELGEYYKHARQERLSWEAFNTMIQIGSAIDTIRNHYKHQTKKG